MESPQGLMWEAYCNKKMQCEDLTDQVAALTKERDALKAAAKLANAFLEWNEFGNCRAEVGPIPSPNEVSKALKDVLK